MANWKNIDELRQIFIEKYTKSKLSAELEKACSEEYELMRDYNGRQILELLQNVDDACNGNDEKSKVYIKYENNILEVGNTGTTFTADTIERLCLGRSSNKSSTNIGNKGTGFRSLLNDAEWIEIHSGDFSIRFSEKYTSELFKKYIDKEGGLYCELIENQLKDWKKDYPLCFPILNCPEKIEKQNTEFDTFIRVKIKESKTSKTTSIDNQLKLPFYKSILFLPNIVKIEIETNGSTKTYEKCSELKENYEEVLIEDNNNNTEHYYVFKKQVSITSEKFADLIIAYPLDKNYDYSKEKLYCYFPIRNFQTPIHALVHAPFLTNSSRDDVLNDNEQINYFIFKELISFIKETAETLKDLKDANAIEFVTPINFNSNKIWDTDSFNLKNFYLNSLCDSKIIPTVNNEFISINDNPKHLSENFPEEFKEKGFENLVKGGLNQDVYKFIEKLCSEKHVNFYFDSESLSKSINIHSSEYNIESAVKIFLWWSSKSDYRNSQFLPNLLKDTNENWVQKEYKVFLPTNDGISLLSDSLKWVKLCVLKQEYVTKLIDAIKNNPDLMNEWTKIKKKYSSENTSDKRLLDAFSDSNLALNFTEQSSSRSIISEITNQVDNIEKSKSFINWFFENYKDKMDVSSQLAELKFLLPSKDGNLVDTKQLYFGSNYNNDLADKLFRNTDYHSLCSLDEIYSGTAKDEFIDFVKRCGVLYYPENKKVKLDNIDDKNDFSKYVKEKYSFDFNINYLETFSIDNFKNLLLELTTKEVINLLTNDFSLSSLILSTEKLSYAKQQSNWTPSYFNSNEYVVYLLNSIKWIEIGNKKYCPNEIVKYGKLRDKLESLYGINEKELTEILNDDIVKRYNLNFKNDFSEFSDEQIFSIINKLPEKDSTGEISRKLYTDLIKNKKDKEPRYNPGNLKLFAKDGNFHSNKELVYVDKSIPQNISNEKKVDIPIQQSTETIRKWLGVNKIELNLKIKNTVPFDNFSSFDEELKDLKICILSILEETTSNYISKLKRMKVIPCSSIIANDSVSNSDVEIQNYTFIREDGVFYFKLLEKDMNSLRRNHVFATAMVEMFKEAVSPQIPIDLAELLISKNTEEKKQIIEEKFGIDKWNSSYESIFEKSKLSNLIFDFFENNKLKEDILEKIKNIDFSSELVDEDYSLITESLKSIKKDIEDLNNINIKIDVRDYIKRQCINYLNSKRNIYKTNCYSYLLKYTDKQKDYLSMIYEYENYDFSNCKIENSINFSPTKLIKEKFSLFNEEINDEIDIDSKYDYNYEKCIEHKGVSRIDFDYFIEDNNQMKSLLYFNSIEKVVEEFLCSKNNAKEDSSSNNENGTGTEIITRTINAELVRADDKEKTRTHSNNEYGEKKSKQINESNERAGREAEEIAYNELSKNYPHLIWHSKYSKRPADKNNLPPNGIACDMWCQADDKNTYFEIKSSITEFEMSINEYKSMKNNKNNYYVVLVNRDTKEISKYLFDKLDSLKEPSKYKFKFKQVKASDCG